MKLLDTPWIKELRDAGELDPNAYEYLLILRNQFHIRLHSTEGKSLASNREIRQWFNDGAVIINGLKPKPMDKITFPINQLVLFPKGQRRCTII